MQFNKKLIMCGDVIEIYEYGMTQYSGFGKSEKAKQAAQKTRELNKKDREELQRQLKEAQGADKEKLQRILDAIDTETIKRRDDNLARTKKELRRLINANAYALNKFVTLTFAENQTDVDEAHKCFRAFVKRMRRARPDFQYICVVEFQKRGAVHYHLLSNLKYIAKNKLQEIWKHGFVDIHRIDRVDNIGAYVVKYMNKDNHDVRLVGKKCWFASENLDKPVVETDDKKIDQIVGQLGLQGKEIYKCEFENEYIGKTTYMQFNLSRKDEK
ncbi:MULTISPECIES: hypothetical protein [Bacillus cereus group]|uniref:rolling circle replication-associated protein n=2 Tax=Bacillus TaxID=1386 RepID=UPI0022E11D80|nr:hypothetical protein [Bacillus mobilis]